jgi:microcystin-dependent protein
MGQPFVGEIRMFAGNFAPAGWAFCSGQTLPISENEVLFQLIGTIYGGDGQTTFNLPNLQSRVPVHMGQGPGVSNNYTIGEQGGAEQVTLTVNQTPVHNHGLVAATGAGTTANAKDNVLAASPSVQLYTEDTASVALNANSITPTGGSQPHDNTMPYLAINYIISLFGIYPSQV